MRKIFKYQKPISLIVLVSLSWICMPQLSAQAVMVTTENIFNDLSRSDSDLARIRAFVSRKDVISQLQFYGISSEEALARVDSLTDQEIAQISGRLDQLPTGGTTWNFAAGAAVIAEYALIAAAIIAIVVLIIMYALDEGPFKPTYREF